MDITVGSKPKVQVPAAQQNSELLQEVTTISRKVKLIENSISSFRASLQSIEQNFVKHTKESTRDIKTLEEENDELKEQFRQIKDTMKKILEDFEDAAQKTEVDTIKQYLDLWNPVKFTTPEQVRKLAADVFEEQFERIQQKDNRENYNNRSDY